MKVVVLIRGATPIKSQQDIDDIRQLGIRRLVVVARPRELGTARPLESTLAVSFQGPERKRRKKAGSGKPRRHQRTARVKTSLRVLERSEPLG